MKTIKYTVDKGFRRTGEVRCEEDAVAENLILRGFAEAVKEDETPEEEVGDGSAIDQYHPEGVEADVQDRGGVQPLPAELNAPGEVGSNAPAPKASKAKKEAAAGEPEPVQEPTGDAQRTDAQEARSPESGSLESETHTESNQEGEQAS